VSHSAACWKRDCCSLNGSRRRQLAAAAGSGSWQRQLEAAAGSGSWKLEATGTLHLLTLYQVLLSMNLSVGSVGAISMGFEMLERGTRI
jgi:hypothetical protein